MSSPSPVIYNANLYGRGIWYNSTSNMLEIYKMGLFENDLLKKKEDFPDFMTNTLPNMTDDFNDFVY